MVLWSTLKDKTALYQLLVYIVPCVQQACFRSSLLRLTLDPLTPVSLFLPSLQSIEGQGFDLRDDPMLFPFIWRCPVVERCLSSRNGMWLLVFGLQKPVTNAIVLCSFSSIRIALDDQRRTVQEQDTWDPFLPGSDLGDGLTHGWAAWPRGSTTNVPGWLSFPHYILNFTDVTFHFKRNSIFQLANRHNVAFILQNVTPTLQARFVPNRARGDV